MPRLSMVLFCCVIAAPFQSLAQTACNAAAQSGSDIGDKINNCIQNVLTKAPVGGEVVVPVNSSGCYSFSHQIMIDRPVYLHGESTGFNGQGTCLNWTGGAAQAIVINGQQQNVATANHSILEKLDLQNSGTGTVGIDIYNGQYNVTLRDVTVEQGSAPFSVAGIRLGNNASGSPTIDTLLENVRIAYQVVGLQILLANTPMCSPCHIYNASNANVQLGDSNHAVFMASFHGGNIEQDVTSGPNVIVNNAEGVNFYGVYTETTNGGNWMQVPSTAVMARAIRFYGGRFQCNGSITNIFNLSFSGTELTVDGPFVQNCPAGSVFVQNTASRRVWLNDISAVDNNLSLYSGTADSSGVVNFGSSQQDPKFKSLVPLADQAALGSSTNRWDGLFYAAQFFRSQGNSSFPDIFGDGTHPLVIAGNVDGSGNVIINSPTFARGVGNLIPSIDQAALGSSTNRWDGFLYNAQFFRSQGNPSFPDISGDGTHPLVIAGKLDGSGSVIINSPSIASPSITGTDSGSEILQNKTLASPTITGTASGNSTIPQGMITHGTNGQCLTTSGGVTAWGNCSGSTTFTHPTIVTGIVNSGTGFQHFRPTSCLTPAATFGACGQAQNWPTAWADTNYTVTCTADTSSSAGFAYVMSISSKTTTSVTVNIQNVNSNSNATSVALNCIGVHD